MHRHIIPQQKDPKPFELPYLWNHYISNPNSSNRNSTAWTARVHTREDQMFAKIQSKLTKRNAGNCQHLSNFYGTFRCSRFFQGRRTFFGSSSLWSSIQNFHFFEADSELKSRTQSATLFWSLEKYFSFVLRYHQGLPLLFSLGRDLILP